MTHFKKIIIYPILFIFCNQNLLGNEYENQGSLIQLQLANDQNTNTSVSQNKNKIIIHRIIQSRIYQKTMSGFTIENKQFFDALEINEKRNLDQPVDLQPFTVTRTSLPLTIQNSRPRMDERDFTKRKNRKDSVVVGSTFIIEYCNSNESKYSCNDLPLPDIVSESVNIIKNNEKMDQIEKKLQEDYQETRRHFSSTIDNNFEKAKELSQQSNIISNLNTTESISRIVRPHQSGDPGFNYNEYLMVLKSPTKFEEYSASEEDQTTLVEKSLRAAKHNFARDFLENSEILLNQDDPKAREKHSKTFNKYYQNGILKTQAFNQKEPSLADGVPWKTTSHTMKGQSLKRVVNKAQIHWIESEGLSQSNTNQITSYLAALVTLQAADNKFVTGDLEEGFSLLESSDYLLEFSKGYVKGGSVFIAQTVKALPELAKALTEFTHLAYENPSEAGQKLVEFIEGIPQMVGSMAAHYVHLLDQVQVGNAEQKGEALGELSAEILVSIASGGGASSLTKLTKGQRLISKAQAHLTQVFNDTQSVLFRNSLQLALTIEEQAGQVFKTVARQDPSLAIKMSEALYKLDNIHRFEFLDLAFKNPQVAKSNSIQIVTKAINNDVIKTGEHLTVAKELLPVLNKMPHQLDIRLIGEKNKIALIGQDMAGNVSKIQNELSNFGIKAETFSLSQDAVAAYNDLLYKYKHHKIIPIEESKLSLGYIENQNWIKNKIDNGYTILDANNPNLKPHSIFYGELERKEIRMTIKKGK